MTIAELFVNLGVKGDGPAQKALQNTKTKLGEVKSMGLETKAMILAVVYGLEKMMSSSAQAGTGFSNFAANTGLSVQKLQQWQYAARQVGVGADEVEGSVRNVQTAITNMLMGKGAPEGFAMVANKVGLDPKRMRDTYYMMEQLQKFAKSVPPDVAANMLKSFGLSENVVAAMQKNAFRPEVMTKAPTYSDNEIGRLNKVDVAWANLGAQIKMAMGHLTSKHGLQLVSDISKVTGTILKLISSLITLSEKLKVFDWVGKIFSGWDMLLKGVTGSVDEIQKNPGGMIKGVIGEGKNILSGMKDAAYGALLTMQESGKTDVEAANKDAFAKKVVPSMKPTQPNKVQNINVKQDLHFQHEGKDHKQLGKSAHKATQEAYRQYSAQTQGT